MDSRTHTSLLIFLLGPFGLLVGSPVAAGITHCTGGTAGGFPCDNVDLLSHLPGAEIGGGSGTDIWGWRDQASGREFALVGRSIGTAFVEVTNPTSPVYVGLLPSHTTESSWRDIKVFGNRAYVVAEAPGHGLQVFDLRRLLTVTTPPQTFSSTSHYSGFGNSHNLAINEDSGYGYAVGTGTCAGGLHMVDVTLRVPAFAGCFSADGYTHDVQCVNYSGPDIDYLGKEICFASNEDTVTIVDVTDKSAPLQISRTGYPGSAYTHQGWLTEDQAHFLLTDELDESSFGHNTRLYVWDVTDLDAPTVAPYTGSTQAVDHNVFIKGNRAFLASFRAGLRILDISGIANNNLFEVGFLDTYPPDDLVGFEGAWGVYPFFDSGVVVIGDTNEGLVVVDTSNFYLFGDGFESGGLDEWSNASQ